MSESRLVPLPVLAAVAPALGAKVARLTQSVLMSSSMARTAPARTSTSARSVMFMSGPPT